MKTSRNKLALVSSNIEAFTRDQSDIGNIAERWRDAERQLTTLRALEEEYFDNVENCKPDAEVGKNLLAQQTAIERLQRNLLSKLTAARSEDEIDIVTKLEIWKETVVPNDRSLADAQPTDLLIYSVLDDILNGAFSSK